jgi:putative membrane-bound dehydrogenase-like protein
LNALETSAMRPPSQPSSLIRFAAFLALLTGSLAANSAASAGDADRVIPKFTLPEGFVVERVVDPAQCARPIMAGLDELGRLFVAESAGLNLDAKQLLEQKPNFMRRLVDRDGDGHFETSTLFASGMTFPSGALAHRGSVYVASPPYIWRLTDTNDDGVADSQEIVVGKFGFVGNAADIHGCFLAPNGRLVWCDGRHGHEFLDDQGNVTSQGKAARIFSCNLDGSDVQAHCGGGMDNPVEVDFLPSGEMVGTVNLLLQKRGDCLMHWLHGGVYPRYDQPTYTAEFKRTGDLLGPVIDMGHVAVSGMLRYRNDQFGSEFRDNIFICEFNTHKLVRVRLERSGSSYVARREEFLTCTDPDFHPTDVLEDADGSLLLVDTGGWFRNGCPTSQVAKPEIVGGIYRIRAIHRPTVSDPRGLSLAWNDATPADLIARLDDPRPVVRERALDTLAQRGDAAIAPLAARVTSGTSEGRINAIWALTRIGSSAASKAVHPALADASADVRQTAACAFATLNDPFIANELATLVEADLPAVQREAATTLGRLRHRAAVPALLSAVAKAAGDRALEHALIYALIEIDDPDATTAGLAHDSSQVRRAALVALDQMDTQRLTRDQVAPLLDTDDALLKQAVIDVIAKHAGWAEELKGLLRQWLTEVGSDPARATMTRGALLAFVKDQPVQELIGASLADSQLSDSARALLLEVVARSGIEPSPAHWLSGVEQGLAHPSLPVRSTAVQAARALGGTSFIKPLASLAQDDHQPTDLRRQAAAARAGASAPLDAACFDLLVAQLAPGTPALIRMEVAEALGLATLDPAQRQRLLPHVAAAGPLELPALVRAYEREPHTADVGVALAGALKESPGLASLGAARLDELFIEYPASARTAAQALREHLAAQQQAQHASLAEWGDQLATGNAERGQDLFHSTQVGCTACHTIAGKGGQIGPDLSKIGTIREPRILLESIVLPSANLARGYESYSVQTAKGLIANGVIHRETPEAIWLRTADRAELRIARDEIDDLAPSPRSIMPEGLDRVLSPTDLADVVAYLSSLK